MADEKTESANSVYWSRLEHSKNGVTPSKRSGHSLTILNGNQGALFGGIDLRSPPGPNNELFSFEIGPSEVTWTKVDAAGTIPPPRWRHTATAISKTQMIVFGGFHDSTTRLNDLYLYDSQTKTWSQPVQAMASALTDGAQFRRVKKVATNTQNKVVLATSRTSKTDEEEKKGDGPAAPVGGNKPTSFLEELGVPLNDPQAQDGNPDAPTPRGAHSAVMIGEYLYIFGGYGGIGYQRKDFNDLFRLHLPTMTWAKQDPTAISGEPPQARSGHTAVPCKQQMLIFGGWSTTAEYNDLWSFDTEKLSWSIVETGRFGPNRWNHSAVAVVAVPYWQVFIYGGSGSGGSDMRSDKDKGTYLGDMLVLNTGGMTIRDVTVQDGTTSYGAVTGTPPKPRADASMVYDTTSKRLIVFGGWNNKWSNETHALSVTPIVGPPYAVLGLRPTLGPITGQQKLIVEGMGFEPKVASTVRFIFGKKFVEAAGEAISSTEMEVNTPSYEHIGPGTVDIRVSLKSGLLTITSQKYSFFNVVDSRNCFGFGAGLLTGLAVNVPVQFYIQARDTANLERQTGQDEFTVEVIQLDEDGKEGKEPVKLDGVTVKDEDNGRYLVSYMAPAAGQYKVKVDFAGTYQGKAGPIRGSPFITKFVDDGNKDNNKVMGQLAWDSAKDYIETVTKVAQTTLDGITKEVPHDNLEILLAVKNHLSSVGSREAEMRLKLDMAEGLLNQAKRDGSRKPKEIETLLAKHEKAIETWENCRKEAPKCRATIAPLVKTFSANTRKEIEQFEADTFAYAKKADENPYWKFETGYEAATKAMDDAQKAQVAHLKLVDRNIFLANTFEFPTIMNEINKTMKSVQEDIDELRKTWATAKETREFLAASKELMWNGIKPEELEETAKNLQKKVKLGGTKKTRASGTVKGLDKQIKDFLQVTPLIMSLGHKSMRPRHWALLMKATKKTFTPPNEDPNMKLQNLLELGMHEFVADVEEICDQALKEEKMEETLVKLENSWKVVVWVAEPYKEGSPVNLLKIAEEDFEMLEADQLAVQGMMASRYLATFEAEVTGWQKGLAMVADVLMQLADIQRKWAYLEPLFIGSEEVRRELPEAAERFVKVDGEVRKNLAEMHATGNAKNACNRPGLYDEMDKITTELDRCEKALSDFLDGKRRQFPRFYFVSKSDLLDILSNGSQPRKIMVHVSKVFLQTDTLFLTGGEKSSERPTATGWKAGVGVETVDFTPAVPLEGKVEIYMQTVLDGQRGSLKGTLERSVARYPTQKRTEWLLNRFPDGKPTDPAQISLLVSGMEYVKLMEVSFDNLVGGDPDGMRKGLKQAEDDLADLVRLTMTNLSKADRSRVMCMITLDAHGRDIFTKMVLENVPDKTAFQWQSQLKQRWIDNETHMHIADARFFYSYEYLGNGPRLVVTPLTDRIYVTATQALNLKMGCAPAGPAGTGKTESTKDLANALAITCYVFNCAPEMDYTSLGNIFKGLAASGTWGCFDEFNRLIPEVLSVCSVQFKAVCDGVKAQRRTVVVEGDEVSLFWTVGAFITMNPGYLGRSELPEGLKALFRPITVMVPDLVLICENMLMAEGFIEAKVLASKFYSLYSLLRELLSKQGHYDWGLRAIKSVLVVAGSFKRAEPDLPEQALLCRALRDFNIPKIVKQDEVIFFGLLGDLFPGIDPPRKVDPVLEDAVSVACVKKGLDPDPLFRLKVVQLEELLVIRHCVFVMGPPAAAKSQCWLTLQAARTELKRKTKVVDLDPKAVTPEELYGYIHPASREWRDGLMSKIMRDLGAEPGDDPKWILLDGDLDANWIESMNSVMDDNKMLTLASNERIPLKGHMRMIFEIRDLDHATPATVSRAGIIYISTNTGSQWRSIIKSWLLKLKGPDGEKDAPENVKHILKGLFERYCAPTLLFIKKECKPMVPVEDVTLVTNLIRALKCLYTPAIMKKVIDPATPPEEATRILDTFFVFAAVWAFGSTLSLKDGEDYRARFSEFWKGEFKTVRFQARDTVFDYYLDPATLAFDSWKNSPLFKTIDFDSRKTPMSSVTVPTPETCSVVFWMEQLVAQRDPVMLVGYAGCGKTQLVNGLLAAQKPEERLSHVVNFNYFTDSRALQVVMEAPLEKKAGINYGPPGKAYLIYYLDDLNLPFVDQYNTQSAIAVVRELLDYGHWYDRAKLSLKNIQNGQFVSSLNPTAGSFVINPRLQRHFFSLAIGFPGPTSLHTIFSTFLEGHLKPFNEDVQGCAQALLGGALLLHASVASTFRKSAANFHYEFSVRHLSSVFQGILMANPDQFKTVERMIELWLHESERVYGDRLVSIEDLEKYRALALAQSKKKFPSINMGNFFGPNCTQLVFCHFVETTAEKVYDRVMSMDKLKTILDESLREHNEVNAAMNLVLFEDALKHVCRITRIILNPSGHALLVGVGGSGKQSLSRLGAFICNYRVSQIVISGNYGLGDLKEDLKKMYNFAGVKEEGVMFLFTDSQIVSERFLVPMNDLLASGNIPDLFAPDEVDTIVNAMTPRVKGAGLTVDKTTCWKWFIDTVKRNLHVVLCFSPVGEDIKTRAKRFPALINCTVLDWFQPWPKDALQSVGAKFLKDIENIPDAVRSGIENFMPFSFESVNKMAVRYKDTDRRYVYTTPKSYLELLKLYKALLAQKRVASTAAINRLATGLDKLRETGALVSKIEEELKVKLVEAEAKKAEAAVIAADVAANKAIVEEETAKATAIANEAAEVAARASAIKADAERDLEAALPAVEAAMAALNTLNKKDLGECKTMQKPPAGVDDVFAACIVLLANVNKNVVCSKAGKVADANKTWDAAKKQLLGDIGGFLQSLMDYKGGVDSGAIPEGNFKDVRAYLELPHFNVETIKTKNGAAAGLVSWVINIVTYRDIVVTVEPKKAKAAAAKAETDEAMGKKNAAETQVAELTATLNKLITKLNEAEATKAAAEATVERGLAKASLANRLTNALADENVRWAASIETLTAEQEMLIGDVLLASSFISYIGPFTKRYRDILMNETWVPFLETAAGGQRIPMSPKPDPLAVLTTEAQVAGWNGEGLPDDKVSVENGCIVNCTARWPLMIDPQLQGITWVRERERVNELVIVRLEQKDMIRKLKMALEKGTPVLIENMGERVDAVLAPVISRSLTKKGNRMSLKLGDDEVEYNPKFRLYMHTKLSNPHYPPEIQAEACLINFTVTEAGLEDQLLVLTVAKERPDLAAIKKELGRQQNAFKIQVKELEDGILKRLAEAQGDITEDRELIEGLENTKRIAMDIAEKQVIAKQTEQDINVTSEKYRPVAHRAALLFFLMNELFKVHTYYIYSLSAFVTIFIRSIDLVSGKFDPMFPELDDEPEAAAAPAPQAEAKEGEPSEGAPPEGEAPADAAAAAPAAPAPKKEREIRSLSDSELVQRCEILKESATFTSFKYVLRGAFERDKLTIATQLCLKILIDSGELNEYQSRMLVVGPTAPADPGPMGELAEWLPSTIWPKVKAMESIKPVFEKLGDDMQSEMAKWRQWFDDEKPEAVTHLLPGDYKNTISGFNLLLILRAMRPDRLVQALRVYVGAKLGQRYVVQDPYDMAATFAESSRATPMFFVLFPGVDPTVWVETLGKKLGFTVENNKFLNISMGQGQEAPAMQSLQNYAKDGGWLMLQNVHLMQAWLPLLERQLEIASESAHEDFRCFISGEPPPFSYFKNMPESLLQSCIKVANEAPADLLSNLTRSWVNFSQERINDNLMQTEFKACLMCLIWYHSIVLGRRRFGQQGFSRKYAFNTGDLTVCANVLFEYLNVAAGQKAPVPWQDLQYIFGEVMYGGHITDAWDRRTNNTYLQVYLTPKILSNFEIGPGFPMPDFASVDYMGIDNYIKEKLPKESPPMFGLHPNAEIGYLTAFSDDIFFTILSMAGGSGGGGGGAGAGVRGPLNDLLDRIPENFGMIDMEIRAEPLLLSPSGPFVIVAMQECARMNDLLDVIRRTLIELRKGLDGTLNMSEPMEDLSTCLGINLVPGRNPFHKCNWEKYAWPSRRSLSSWFLDLLRRVDQLASWSSTLTTPISLWLPGIFNPMAILTAIMQVTARSTGLPLDKMAIDTHVTTYLQPQEAKEYAENGMYAHGLFMEGARWAIAQQGDDAGDVTVVGHSPTAGYITESRLKQLLPPMPLLYLRAVPVKPTWLPSGVGFLRQDPKIYDCPVYATTFRGPTYIFLATLTTRQPVSVWTLAATALMMQEDQ